MLGIVSIFVIGMHVLRPVLLRVIPICIAVGASMEFFMIKTGFYDIVTRKAAERQALEQLEQEKRQKRLQRLNIKFGDSSDKK